MSKTQAPDPAHKHTHGQWRVFGARAECGTSNEIRVEGKLIARVFMNGNPLEREANARLIAAAPELMKLLSDFVADFRVTTNDGIRAYVAEARAAIAKATGAKA